MTLQAETFIKHRKRIYASLNSIKGNLMTKYDSSFLSKKEKELLKKVIDAMEELRVEYFQNRGNKTEAVSEENVDKKLTKKQIESIHRFNRNVINKTNPIK
jgi:hypothetical protein